LITDACAYQLFYLCSLLDGVTEPNVIPIDGWTGGTIATGGNNELMLHDEFYETYWDFNDKYQKAGADAVKNAIYRECLSY
jgi:hypothetical protein